MLCKAYHNKDSALLYIVYIMISVINFIHVRNYVNMILNPINHQASSFNFGTGEVWW